jgi:hypothetical protein
MLICMNRPPYLFVVFRERSFALRDYSPISTSEVNLWLSAAGEGVV